MAIRCGSTGHDHETVAEVRACQLGGTVMTAPTEVERFQRNAASTADGERAAARIGSYGYPFRPATEKMTKWVRDILANQEVRAEEAEHIRTLLDSPRGIGFDTARRFINAWKDAPRKPKEEHKTGEAPEAEVTEDGIYRHPKTGQWIKVQWNKAGGDGRRLYAKRLVVETEAERDEDGKVLTPAEIRWEYTPGLIAEVKPDWRGTKEDAAQFGALYGRCQECRRALTLEESIERAMGLICWGKVSARHA